MSGGNLPDDTTHAMVDSLLSAGDCLVCERPTEFVCDECDGSLCDLESCESGHVEQTGHQIHPTAPDPILR